MNIKKAFRAWLDRMEAIRNSDRYTESAASRRIKNPGCKRQREDEPYCRPVVRNSYKCDDCGAAWQYVWWDSFNDFCPNCKWTIAPSSSQEIAPCACEMFGIGDHTQL